MLLTWCQSSFDWRGYFNFEVQISPLGVFSVINSQLQFGYPVDGCDELNKGTTAITVYNIIGIQLLHPNNLWDSSSDVFPPGDMGTIQGSNC